MSDANERFKAAQFAEAAAHKALSEYLSGAKSNDAELDRLFAEFERAHAATIAAAEEMLGPQRF
jgi:hypothetical protein